MEIGMRRLDEEKKKANELLYQCMPRSIARALRRGVNPLDTLKTFDQVSILFSKIVDFNSICMEIDVRAIVQLLNLMYSRFDQILDKHHVYKVETISDSYLIVSGAPNKTPLHAAHIAEMAFDMVAEAHSIANPADRDGGGRLQLQIGCHSGGIAAGVVGLRMPRYCLFGDTVNVSSRMMSHGAPGRIHVSENFHRHLRDLPYRLSERGRLEIKGKGGMTTYFLDARERQGHVELRRRLDEDRDRQHEVGADSGTPESRPSTVLSVRVTTPSLDGADDEDEAMKLETGELDDCVNNLPLPSLPATPMPQEDADHRMSRKNSKSPGTPTATNSTVPAQEAVLGDIGVDRLEKVPDAQQKIKETSTSIEQKSGAALQDQSKVSPQLMESEVTEDLDATREQTRENQSKQELRLAARSPTPNAIQKVENFIMSHPLGCDAAADDDAEIPVDTGADDDSTSPSMETLTPHNVAADTQDDDSIYDDESESELPSDSAASYTSDPQPHLVDDLKLLVPQQQENNLAHAVSAAEKLVENDERTLVSEGSSSEFEDDFDEGDDRKRGRGTGIVLGGPNFVGRVYSIDKKQVKFTEQVSYREISPLIQTPASEEAASADAATAVGKSESPPLVLKALSVFLPKNKRLNFQANFKEVMNLKSAGVKTSPRVSTSAGTTLSPLPSQPNSELKHPPSAEMQRDQHQTQQSNERRRRVGIVELAQNPLLRALQQKKAAEEAAREHEPAQGNTSAGSSRSSSTISTFRTPSSRQSPTKQSQSVIAAAAGPSRLLVPQAEAPGSPLFSRRSSAATTDGSGTARQTPLIIVGEGRPTDEDAKQSEVPRLPDIKLNQKVAAPTAAKDRRVASEPARTAKSDKSAERQHPDSGGTVRQPVDFQNTLNPDNFHILEKKLEPFVMETPDNSPESTSLAFDLPYNDAEEDCSEWKFCVQDATTLTNSCRRIRTPRGDYGRQMKRLGAVLSQGLAELAERRPADPIEHLGLWLRHTARVHCNGDGGGKIKGSQQ